MVQRATTQQSTDNLHLAGRYVLAIEPDLSQARVLETKMAGHEGVRYKRLASIEDAVATFADAIPDLILVSSALSPRDEEQIISRLYSLGVDASSVQLLPISRFVGAKAKKRASPTDADPLDGISIENIEHLLGPIDMPTTTRELNIDAAPEPGGARLPRFLTPDDRIPLPLRALLDEAEGCLKMSFLNGAGACALRALDLLLAEQSVDGADRAEQIQQLGKKHPAVGDSFIGTLAVITNNPSGTWEDSRVRLAIAILKSIGYEIYVLGPERSERAAYVLDLLKKFKATGRA